MSHGIHMPSLRDAGSDAHQIRRACERAFADLDSASLRAERAGFRDIADGLREVLGRVEALRLAAEQERRVHTPDVFRRVGSLHDQH